MVRVNFGTYTIEVPQGWTLSSVILSGPVEPMLFDDHSGDGSHQQPFQRNLITTLEAVADSVTVESYVKQQVDGLKQAEVHRQGLDIKEFTLANGLQGLITEQIILGPGAERVRQLQLVVIKDSIAYTSIASELDGDAFEKAREEFEQMLKSFL